MENMTVLGMQRLQLHIGMPETRPWGCRRCTTMLELADFRKFVRAQG